MTDNKLRRKKLYLGWKQHGRIVARVAMYLGVYPLAILEALWARDYLSSLSRVGHPMPLTEVVASFFRQNAGMVSFSVIFAAIIVWDVVRLTNRIIGPLKRVEDALYRMAEGQGIGQLTFRKGDLIEGLEKAFNTYLSSLHASSDEASGTAASREEKKGSPNATPSDEHCEPQGSIGDEQIAAIFDEFRSMNGTANPIQVDGSADGNADPIAAVRTASPLGV
jgi:methyl-accepting chemotaxis protein